MLRQLKTEYETKRKKFSHLCFSQEKYSPNNFFCFLSGTRVLQLLATDQDEGPNGEISYSIVSQHNKFTIDEKTGWLSTQAVRK